MFCCSSSPSPKVEDPSNLGKSRVLLGLKARDARITAIILSLLTLFLYASSFVLYGVGTISPTALLGLGIFPYLGGALFNFVGIGLLCGSVIFAAISGVQTCRKEKLEKLLSHEQ